MDPLWPGYNCESAVCRPRWDCEDAARPPRNTRSVLRLAAVGPPAWTSWPSRRCFWWRSGRGRRDAGNHRAWPLDCPAILQWRRNNRLHRRNSRPVYRPESGSAPTSNLLYGHKWKRGAKENAETVSEIHRKARQIAPAYNKGALQYLPPRLDKWPDRLEQPRKKTPRKK